MAQIFDDVDGHGYIIALNPTQFAKIEQYKNEISSVYHKDPFGKQFGALCLPLRLQRTLNIVY